jgi:hypothetical protein
MRGFEPPTRARPVVPALGGTCSTFAQEFFRGQGAASVFGRASISVGPFGVCVTPAPTGLRLLQSGLTRSYQATREENLSALIW